MRSQLHNKVIENHEDPIWDKVTETWKKTIAVKTNIEMAET